MALSNARHLVATCREEGGLYTPDKDARAPIRIYSDGTIEDEICAAWGMPLVRERIAAEDVAAIERAAAENRARGRV